MADNENFDFDSFDFGEFDSLDTGVKVQRQPTMTPDVSDIVTSLKKRAMIVIFVIDISGSMKGARIGAVNDAIRNVLPELKKREKGNTSAEIKVAIMEFSTNARWRTLIPEPVSTFQYTDITDVYGGTNYGKAFEKLITEYFGQVWEDDHIPFWEAGDIELNGQAYQIKYDRCNFCNEKQMLNFKG